MDHLGISFDHLILDTTFDQSVYKTELFLEDCYIVIIFIWAHENIFFSIFSYIYIFMVKLKMGKMIFLNLLLLENKDG